MTAQDYVSQDSPRASGVHDTSGNDVNRKGHPDDAWVDVEADRSVSSTNSSSRLRARRTRAGPVAPRPGPTRKHQQQPPHLPRRKYFVEYSESGSEVDEAELTPPPHLPPVQQTAQTIQQPATAAIWPQPVEPIPQHQPAEPAAPWQHPAGLNAHQQPSRPATMRQPTDPATRPAEPTVREKLTEFARSHVITISEFVIQVVADAFQLCRRSFSYTLALLILCLLWSALVTQFTFFARPICSLPIISPRISSCSRGNPKGHIAHGNHNPRADHPRLVDIQTRTFDQLLDGGVADVVLSSEVMKAEMATNDLITLVKASELGSRDQIAATLGRFVDDARGTGRSLTSLGAKVLGAIDSITVLNDHVLRTIEASAKGDPSFLARLVPFASSSTGPTKEAVLETFLISMEKTSNEMARLRTEAGISMRHLERLREHLRVLHETIHGDNEDLTAEREEILGELWARLRRKNKRKLQGIDRNLDLLKNVDKYRKKASAHVRATIQTLDTLDADMENLRTRMAAPDVIGEDIPIDVHVESIKTGVERLKDRQLRARLKQDESIVRILEIDT